MKKAGFLLLAVLLLFSAQGTVHAADASRKYFFELSVDGSHQKQVQPGDIITVVFTLYRTDTEEPGEMYAMQNEIRYDSSFFRLVEGSEVISDGILATEIGLRDTFREFYMNFVSMAGGELWEAERRIGSFQLEVIAASGMTKITNQDYLVSAADGKETYAATCQDVSIILTTDCKVIFESNAGAAIAEQVVPYGKQMQPPEDPVRSGYHFAGWYTDMDLQIPWNFDRDVVQHNMTLYARWEQGETVDREDVEKEQTGQKENTLLVWLLPGAGLLGAAALILIFWCSRKTVRFETNCKMQIREQKIKKGGFVERPEQPARNGRTFAGWFYDIECTERWDFESDKVVQNMTLYAKWI